MKQDRMVIGPSIASESGELRVFISCDLQDMRAERDVLARRVFPELERICRSRGIEFTQVDLRKGVQRTFSQQTKLLRLSLDELERHRPHVIGLVGSRYAALADGSPAEKDLRRLADHDPELAALIADGRSLFDIETDHGVLAHPEMRERAFYYFRPFDPEISDAERERVETLNNHIRTSGVRVRDIEHDLDAFASWVRDDLLGVINRLVPEGVSLTALELERRGHETFAASRRQSYLPKQEVIERLDWFVTSEAPPLVIYGTSGSGKSALVAYWTAAYRRNHPDAFVVTHYVGALSSADTRAELLRRVIREIRERVGDGEETPTSPEELIDAFPFWLAKAAVIGMVLLVDGAGQLDEGSRNLEWLPEHLPPGVRVIITVNDLPTRVLDAGWPTLLLEPLSVHERMAITSSYLAERHVGIEPERAMQLAADASSANPLFLRTRLEELRLFGAYERRGKNLDSYLAAEGLDDLFDRVLERVEDEFGTQPLSAILSAVWGARHGMSEQEMEQMVGCTRLELADVLGALDYHLLRTDGRLRFYHDALRGAVQRRYVPDGKARRVLHRALAQYFDTTSFGTRRAEELPWQLQQAGDIAALKERLAGIDLLLPMVQEEKAYELLGYWITAGAASEIAPAYVRAVERFEAEHDDRLELARVLSAVGDFLTHSGLYDGALSFLRRAAAIRQELLGEEHIDTAQSSFNLAHLHQQRGDLDEAEALYLRVLAVQERILGEEHLTTAQTMGNIAAIRGSKGDFDGAEALYRKALRLVERTSGVDAPFLTLAIHNLAGTLYDKGKYDEAEALYRRSVAVWEGAYGTEHPNTAIAMNNLAMVLMDRGERDAARPLLERVTGILERTLGANHPLVGSTLSNWATWIGRDDPAAALPLMNRALEIHERALSEPSAETAILVYALGRIHFLLGDLTEAERYFRRAYDLQCAILGQGHPDAAITMSGLAVVYRERGDVWVAERLFRRALEMLERTLGPEHPTVGIQLANLASVVHRRNDVATTRALAKRALAILTRDERAHKQADEMRELLRQTGGEDEEDAGSPPS